MCRKGGIGASLHDRGHMNSMHAVGVPRRLTTRKWCPQRDVVLRRAKDDDVADSYCVAK